MTANSKTAMRKRADLYRSETAARKRAERDACIIWRSCLGCGLRFPSEGVHNRLCSRCWILKSSATPEVFEEGLGGCFSHTGSAGCRAGCGVASGHPPNGRTHGARQRFASVGGWSAGLQSARGGPVNEALNYFPARGVF